MRHLRLPRSPQPESKGRSPPIIEFSIEDLRAGYDTGVFKPSDVVAAILERIASHEPYLNAFIVLNDGVADDAERADLDLAEGRPRGPLHGIPVVIKDNMNQVGFRTTAGYAGFASDDRVVDIAAGTFNGMDLMPERDATLVARLKQAGAIIVGKSNLPDFGLDGLRADSSHNGDTLNPYGARFAPGASSTGSATAVSAGLGTVSIGTDTAGSILFPASAQSLVGVKPTFGLIPTDGVYPGLSSHHDVVGPIAKSVHDAAVVLEVLVGPADPASQTATGQGDRAYVKALRRGALSGKTIGLYEPGQWAEELHPKVADHYGRMVSLIEGLGARTVPVVFGDTDWLAGWNARTFFATRNSYFAGVDTFLKALGGANPSSRADFKKRAGFEIGLGTTAPLFGLLADPEHNVASDDPRMISLIEEAEQLRRTYEAILATKSIDALFLPRSTTPLPDIHGDTLQYLGDQVVGTQINEMGLPAITVPAGFLDDGRPIAIDIVGRARFTEAEILAFAYDFEQATALRRPPAGY
jgi:amidase